MSTHETIQRYRSAFQERNPALLEGVIGVDCVIENVSPAPDGDRIVGGAACLAYWQSLISESGGRFDSEEIAVFEDRAVMRWRYVWGEGDADYVRGVNIMRVRNDQIVEALGYSKTHG